MLIKTKPYKDIILEFEDEGHISTVTSLKIQTINGIKRKKGEQWNPISVTGATGSIFKELTWWASGEAIKTLGWYNVKKLKDKFKGEEFDVELNKAIANLIQRHKELSGMSDEQYYDELCSAYSAHKRTKDEAGNLGTQIHEWVELYIKGKNPKIPADDKVKNGVLAFMKWVDENKVKFIKSEEQIYSKKYDYVGIMDIEAMVNGKLATVDIKSSNGVYDEMRFQVSGYHGAKEEMTGKKRDERWILHLGKEDGEFHAYLLDNHKADFEAFLGALTVKRRQLELKGK